MYFPKKYFLIALIIIVLVIVLLYFLGKNLEPANPLPPANQESEASSTAIILESGHVGEVLVENEQTGQAEPIVSAILPELISSTVGIVSQVKDNSLIVQGNGSNFADGQPRELTCFFNEKTLTFFDGQTYQGVEGLKQIKVGQTILIEGAENIRGKTEFLIQTINIIQ